MLGLVFAFMIFSVVPWSSALTGKADATPYSFELGWPFPQLAALFLCAAALVGLVAPPRPAEDQLDDHPGRGRLHLPRARHHAGPRRDVIMNNSRITDTVLRSIEGVVEGTSSGLFAIIVFVVNLPPAFLIPPTSGHATPAMPILAPPATSRASRGRWS